jgi:hypothetical protein
MLNKFKNFNWTKNMFLVPILLVAGISISHVVSWYEMANPISWAIYLSIAIEIGAMTSLIAATKKIKGGVWFMFGLVTFIQMMGNIFYSYVQIDEVGNLFKNWVELTSPVFEMMGTDSTDIIPHKRWLALLEGGFLPLISLTALHFYIRYDDSDNKTPKPKDKPNNVITFDEIDEYKDESNNVITFDEIDEYTKVVHEVDKEMGDDVLPPPHKIISEEPKDTKEISEDERQKHLKFRKRIIEDESGKVKTVIVPKRDKISQKIIK